MGKSQYNKDFFENNRASLGVNNYIDRVIAKEHNKKHYKTGIPSIDKATNGGFEEGLCALFAPPSLGKTTFWGQVGYNIAKTAPVLFFSLEMSKEDIVAKYISMQSYLNNTSNTQYAVTVNKLRSKPFIENASEQEWLYVRKAGNDVKERLKDIYIFDTTDGTFTADEIASVVEAFINISQVLPVVIIDYIQRIPVPSKLTMVSEKSQIDHSLNILANLAHNNKILVFIISSMPKAAFNNEREDIGALAGSNNLGYDPDGIYRLTYHNSDSNIDVERKKVEREVDFTIIKQRLCESGKVINLNFYAAFNYFYEPGVVISPEELDEECPFEQQKLDFSVNIDDMTENI